MHDTLPADMHLWHRLESTVRSVFAAYGFEEIRVPVVEKTEVFARAIGRPAVIRTLTTVGLRNRPLMEWTLKVMANLLDPEEAKMTEHVYRAIERTVNIGS